jgi:hypothetical protein
MSNLWLVWVWRLIDIMVLSQMHGRGLGRCVWSLAHLHGCVCTTDIAVHMRIGEVRIAIGKVRVEPLRQCERGRAEDEGDREGGFGLTEHHISCGGLSGESAG